MENPFPIFKAPEKPEAELKDRIKTARITLEEDDKFFALRFDLPSDADWRTVVAYQCALWRKLGDEFDYPLLSNRGDKTYVFGGIKKRDFQKEEVTAWPDMIQDDLLSDDNIERADDDCREIEKRLAVEKAYDAIKKEFLTGLLKSHEHPGQESGPTPTEFLDRLGYRVRPDDLIDQVLSETLDKASYNGLISHHATEDVWDRILGRVFKLKTKTWEPINERHGWEEGASDLEAAERSANSKLVKERLTSAFKDLLKSGPGRNKIKYELKKMSPDYKPRENQ